MKLEKRKRKCTYKLNLAFQLSQGEVNVHQFPTFLAMHAWCIDAPVNRIFLGEKIAFEILGHYR